MPGYEINESLAKSYLTTAGYSTGNFSKIEMSFTLIPNESSIFILSIPNLLLIIISSFVFWMDIKKKLSERLSLGITAMLADFALSFSLPVPDTPDFMYVREYINISYIFIGFSIFFTFTEYVIVSFVYNVKSEEDFTTSELNILELASKKNKLTPRKNHSGDFHYFNVKHAKLFERVDQQHRQSPLRRRVPFRATIGGTGCLILT